MAYTKLTKPGNSSNEFTTKALKADLVNALGRFELYFSNGPEEEYGEHIKLKHRAKFQEKAIDELQKKNAELNQKLEEMEQTPAAVRPAPAKWIHIDEPSRPWMCSGCQDSFAVDTCMKKPQWNYCPHCGSEMQQ